MRTLKKFTLFTLLLCLTLSNFACKSKKDVQEFNDLNSIEIELIDNESSSVVSTVRVLDDFCVQLPCPSHEGLTFIGWKDLNSDTYVTDEKGLTQKKLEEGQKLTAAYDYHQITFKIIAANGSISDDADLTFTYGDDLNSISFPLVHKHRQHFAGYMSSNENSGRLLIDDQGKVLSRYSTLTNFNFEIENNTVILYPFFTEANKMILSIIKGVSETDEVKTIEIEEAITVSEIPNPFKNLKSVYYCTDPAHPAQTILPAGRILTDEKVLYIANFIETINLHPTIYNVKNDNAYQKNLSGAQIDIDVTQKIGALGDIYAEKTYKNGTLKQISLFFRSNYSTPYLTTCYVLSNDSLFYRNKVVGYGFVEASIGNNSIFLTNFAGNMQADEIKHILTCNTQKDVEISARMGYEIAFKYSATSLGSLLGLAWADGFANSLVEYY